MRLISAANAGNADDDLSRVGIRPILGETSASGDNRGKLARIQETDLRGRLGALAASASPELDPRRSFGLQRPQDRPPEVIS